MQVSFPFTHPFGCFGHNLSQSEQLGKKNLTSSSNIQKTNIMNEGGVFQDLQGFLMAQDGLSESLSLSLSLAM